MKNKIWIILCFIPFVNLLVIVLCLIKCLIVSKIRIAVTNCLIFAGTFLGVSILRIVSRMILDSIGLYNVSEIITNLTICFSLLLSSLVILFRTRISLSQS